MMEGFPKVLFRLYSSRPALHKFFSLPSASSNRRFPAAPLEGQRGFSSWFSLARWDAGRLDSRPSRNRRVRSEIVVSQEPIERHHASLRQWPLPVADRPACMRRRPRSFHRLLVEPGLLAISWNRSPAIRWHEMALHLATLNRDQPIQCSSPAETSLRSRRARPLHQSLWQTGI